MTSTLHYYGNFPLLKQVTSAPSCRALFSLFPRLHVARPLSFPCVPLVFSEFIPEDTSLLAGECEGQARDRDTARICDASLSTARALRRAFATTPRAHCDACL